MILSADVFFYLLPAFMNFYCHLVSMATNAFYSEIIFSFIWVRHSFNTETNKNGMEGNVVIIKLSWILLIYIGCC